MIDLYSTLPKKNNHSVSCERVAGRPTSLHVYLALWAFAGGLVNDGSPYDSLDRAVQLSKVDERVSVVDLSRNFGRHKAIMTGPRLLC